MSREVAGTRAGPDGDLGEDLDRDLDGRAEADPVLRGSPVHLARRLLPGALRGPRRREPARLALLVLGGTLAVAASAWALVAPAPAGSRPPAAAAVPPDPGPPPGPRVPVSTLLSVDVLPASGAAAQRTTLERLAVRVRVRNGGPAVRLENLSVTGLGSLLVDGGERIAVPGGGERTLDGTLLPECGARSRQALVAATAVVVLAGGTDHSDPGTAVLPVSATSKSALAPLCPAPRPGIRVAVARVEPAGTGRFAARIVNHGNRGALLVTLQGPDARRARLRSEPALPFGLGPGQTRIVRFTVDVPACPAPVPAAAADQVSIEARTRDGFVEVTGWPEDLTRTALQAAREACLRAGQGNRS